MSFPAAGVIEYLAQDYIVNCCNAAVGALVVYEHIITFDREVLAIWRYRVTGPTILLLLNRYILLLTAISNVFDIFTWASDLISICEAQVVLSNVTYVLSMAIAAGFSALRVYAVTGRNWYWALLALSTGLVPAATNMYQYITESQPYVGYLFGIPQCLQYDLMSNSVFWRFLIATRICAIVSDLVVIVATWMYARPWASHVSDTHIKTPLMLVIVRDGTGYFIVLLILNIAQMATEQVSFYASGDIYVDYITQFLPAIASILISKFIFNLRLHVDEGNNTRSNDPSFVIGSTRSRRSIEFGSRLIGNMGAPLDHSSSDSLLFDDGDEPHEEIGCNEELAVEQIHHFLGHQQDREAGSDAENVGIATTP